MNQVKIKGTVSNIKFSQTPNGEHLRLMLTTKNEEGGVTHHNVATFQIAVIAQLRDTKAGDEIGILGSMRLRTYQNSEGDWHSFTEIVAESIIPENAEAIEQLGNYISDDPDVEFPLLLAAREDGLGDDDADDFVTMWEPLEGRYTVNQLLNMIGM